MESKDSFLSTNSDYRKLIVYKKGVILSLATDVFCRRFLPKFGDRTVDQMKQAARSCKQNIVEGNAASMTSKETEIKLTGVARATLDELAEDYRDWLMKNNLSPWSQSDKRYIQIREKGRKFVEWTDWQDFFGACQGEEFCNAMLTLIFQTKFLLTGLINKLADEFTLHGGLREKMTAARIVVRNKDFITPLRNRLQEANSPASLQILAADILARVQHEFSALAKAKGWTINGFAGTNPPQH